MILTDVDLTHADLSGADLTGVDISGADFFSADLGNTLIDPVALVSARGSVANFMQPACMGDAVELAPAYQGGSASLIVLKQEGGTHRWEDSLPVRFQPAEGELPQLALCVEENEKRVDNCVYVGLGSLPVMRQEASLTLYAAQTGKVLGQTTLLGGDPECPHAVLQGTRKISGGSPSWNAVEFLDGRGVGAIGPKRLGEKREDNPSSCQCGGGNGDQVAAYLIHTTSQDKAAVPQASH